MVMRCNTIYKTDTPLCLAYIPTPTVSPEGSVEVTSDRELYEVGDSAMLTCSHLGGPGNTVQWLRDGDSLGEETDDTYTIPEITPPDIGVVYTCNISNLAGEGQANITLSVGPIITAHPDDTFAVVDSSVIFCCNANGYPPPLYSWNKWNSSLPDSIENYNSSCLVINSVKFGDEGEYFCTATSNNVTVLSNASLLTGE